MLALECLYRLYLVPIRTTFTVAAVINMATNAQWPRDITDIAIAQFLPSFASLWLRDHVLPMSS
jgi:hypothetical protein